MFFSSLLIISLNIIRINCDYDSGDTEMSVLETYISIIPGLRQNLGKKCFKDIGCFSGLEFIDFKEGIPYLPLAPNIIRPDFRIYTTKNAKKAHILKYDPSADEIKETPFNPNHRTILIVHGFRSDIEDWMLALKDLILKQLYNKYNVVLVTWGRGSKVSSYFLAVSNTRVMGGLIAFFINRLCQVFDLRNNMFHLIGHSLGAHIAGFAGKRLFNPKVDLITALDPAGPGFADGYPSLEKTDAKRVVTIHTDIGEHALTEGLGNIRLLGDVDFFPNGGKLQPGCAYAAGIYGALRAIANDQAISCSHQRAYDLATSLGKPGQQCLPVGYLCQNWEIFLEGRCADCGQNNSKCFLMGLYFWYWRSIDFSDDDKDDDNSEDKKYFLNTGAVEDYCLYHYQIALHINNDTSIRSGYLGINIDAKVNKKQKEVVIERRLSESRPGYIHTLLFTSTFRLDSIRSISIKWNAIDNIKTQSEEKVLNIQFVEFNFMSHIYQKVRNKKSAIFCPFDGKSIISEDEDQLDFVKCNSNEKPQRLARNSEHTLLHPITNYKDILAVDYDMIDKVPHKLIRSNLIVTKS